MENGYELQHPMQGSCATTGRTVRPRSCILIAGGDEQRTAALAAELCRDGFETMIARHGGEVLEHLEPWLDGAEEPAVRLLIADESLRLMTGLEILAGLRALGAGLPVILMGARDDHRKLQAEALGGAAVLDRALAHDDIRLAISQLLCRTPAESPASSPASSLATNPAWTGSHPVP